MASFDRVIAISKTVEKYVNENYERHLKRPPRLIYRGSDEEYFSQKFVPSNTYLEDFFTKFPSLRDKKIILPIKQLRRISSLFFNSFAIIISLILTTLTFIISGGDLLVVNNASQLNLFKFLPLIIPEHS